MIYIRIRNFFIIHPIPFKIKFLLVYFINIYPATCPDFVLYYVDSFITGINFTDIYYKFILDIIKKVKILLSYEGELK